jgi:hypothetical protein
LSEECPNIDPMIEYIKSGCAWSATQDLKCGSVTTDITCDPSKNGDAKWSISISTTCENGSVSTGLPKLILGDDTQPGLWPIIFDKGNCECIKDEILYAFYCYPSWQTNTIPFPSYNFFQCAGVPFAGCNQILNSITITKPNSFINKNTFISITGSFDDDIAINGIVLGFCRSGDNHSFILNDSTNTFNLAAVDSFGGFAHGVLTIRFSISELPC